MNAALENAGATRLRPILMTTAASSPPPLTLVVVPVLYNLVESLLGRARC